MGCGEQGPICALGLWTDGGRSRSRRGFFRADGGSLDALAIEIGLTYCGDPLAFYGWTQETQERVIAWWRQKHAPPQKRAKLKDGIAGKREGLSFWGLDG